MNSINKVFEKEPFGKSFIENLKWNWKYNKPLILLAIISGIIGLILIIIG